MFERLAELPHELEVARESEEGERKAAGQDGRWEMADGAGRVLRPWAGEGEEGGCPESSSAPCAHAGFTNTRDGEGRRGRQLQGGNNGAAAVEERCRERMKWGGSARAL
jgi:hypothetical protein